MLDKYCSYILLDHMVLFIFADDTVCRFAQIVDFQVYLETIIPRVNGSEQSIYPTGLSAHTHAILSRQSTFTSSNRTVYVAVFTSRRLHVLLYLCKTFLPYVRQKCPKDRIVPSRQPITERQEPAYCSLLTIFVTIFYFFLLTLFFNNLYF